MRQAWQRVASGVGGGLPAAYWWLWTGVLVNRLGGMVVPFLTLYLVARRGATVAQAGAVASLWGIGAIGSGPVAGLLADRVGRRATMVGALAIGGAGTIALGWATSLPALAGGVLALGFVNEMYRPAMQAAVADLLPALEDRVRAYGLFFWAANLGFSVALVLAGLLAGVSYRLLFLFDGATTLAFGALVAWKVPETRPAGAPAAPSAGLAGLWTAFRDPVLLALVGLNFGVAAMLWQSQTALPMDLLARGVGPSTYGALMALNGVVIVLLQPFAGRALRGREPARVLAAATLLVGAGWGLNAVAAAVPVYALAIVAWTVGEVVTTPTGSALVAELSPPALRGRYQGTYNMSWALAAAAGPAAGAWVLGHLGRGALWGGCLGLGALLAVLHLAAGGPRRRRLERARGAGRC